MTRQGRLVVTVVLLAAVAVFTLQNTAPVEVSLLLWTVSTSRAILIFVALLIGAVIGWGLSAIYRR